MAELGEPLSARELDVLSCIVNGASNKEIAAELFISENTVKVHLRNVYTKLGTSSRTEAVTTALQQGLVTIPGAEITAVSPPEPTSQPNTSTETALESPQPASPEKDKVRNWLIYSGIAVLALILLATAAYFGSQAASQGAATALPPTPEPYQEETIGQSRWFTTRPLAAPLSNMAIASVGLDVYHIGGETETGVTPLVNRYETNTRTWHEMAAKPTAVSHTTAAVLFGEIYVPGGQTADGTPTNIVEAYSPANNAWRPVANLPKALSGGLVLSDGSHLYLLGGWDGAQVEDDVYVYDVGSDSWRPLTRLPVSLAYAAGGVISGQLFVLGGTDGQNILDTCYVYSVATNTWQPCPAMLRPRVNAGAAIILNKLYILGGDEATGTELPFGEFYDADKQIWQVVNMPMLSANKSWENLGVTNVETKIYAMGGVMGNEISDGSYFYSPLVYQTFIPAAASGDE
jgi:DNA-binding CsgD family transcriptional regulator/N-acetylneuraminic acid mutarotase